MKRKLTLILLTCLACLALVGSIVLAACKDEGKTYAITWNVDEHITVAVDGYDGLPEEVKENTDIFFTATPQNGYEIYSIAPLSIKKEDGKYKLSVVDKDVTVTIRAKRAIENITATLKNADAIYYAGQTIVGDDLTVTVKYKDNETETVTSGISVSYENGDALSIGDTKITVSHRGHESDVTLPLLGGEEGVVALVTIDPDGGTITQGYLDKVKNLAHYALDSKTGVVTFTHKGDLKADIDLPALGTTNLNGEVTKGEQEGDYNLRGWSDGDKQVTAISKDLKVSATYKLVSDNTPIEDGPGDGPDGSKDNPYELFELIPGDVNVTVPKGAEVYYSLYVMGGATYTLTTESANVVLKVYTSEESVDDAVTYFTGESRTCTVTVDPIKLTYFVFSTKDAKAGNYTITFVEEQPGEDDEGTELNPKVIESAMIESSALECSDTLDSEWSDVWYTYTTGGEAETLYFAWGEGTAINVKYLVGVDVEIDKSSMEDAADLKAGITIPANTAIKILVYPADHDTVNVSFTISKSPIESGPADEPDGSKDNPYNLAFEVPGEITVNVPAGGKVYYFWRTMGDSVKVSFFAANDNIKLEVYTDLSPEVIQTYQSDGFFEQTVELDAMTYYYFVFSTVDGQAAEYTISVTEEEPEVGDDEGTEENPKVIESAMIEIAYEYFEEISNVFDDAVWYTYTTGGEAETLYFAWGEGTAINVKYYTEEFVEVGKSSMEDDDAAILKGGYIIPANTTIKIEVKSADFETTELFFTVSYSPIEDGPVDEPDGSEDNPYNLAFEVPGEITVNVPAGGKVYYFWRTMGDSVKVSFFAANDNIKLEVYTDLSPEVIQTYQSDGFFEHTVELDAMTYYNFVFSTVDGQAAEYTISVTEEEPEVGDPDGSEENPYVIEHYMLDPYWDFFQELDSVDGEVWYTYTVQEGETLYFAWGEGTGIIVYYPTVLEMFPDLGVIQKELWSTDDGDAAILKSGLTFDLSNGNVIKIKMFCGDPYENPTTELNFTISLSPIEDGPVNEPDGSEDNPYMLEPGEEPITVTVAEGGGVYYTYFIIFGTTTLNFSSDSTNVSLKVYSIMEGVEGATTYNSTPEGFTCSIDVEGLTYFIFSTVDGQADEYTISVAEEEPEVGGDPDGSEENPYVIEAAMLNDGPWELSQEVSSIGEEVWYTYTVQEGETLYFAWGEGTAIEVIYYAIFESNPEWGEIPFTKSSMDEDNAALLKGGLTLEAGKVIKIKMYADPDATPAETLSFTISKSPIE